MCKAEVCTVLFNPNELEMCELFNPYNSIILIIRKYCVPQLLQDIATKGMSLRDFPLQKGHYTAHHPS